MLTELTIQKKGKKELPLDHQQLYALGLKHVQRLSNRLWTDYNVHDPGITILELLCYALTDLGYRAAYPVNDLLATEKENAANMAGQFFTARQIFPNRALTRNDYRKLLIDLDGVKNSWIDPHRQSLFADTLAGKLYQEHPGLEGIEEVSLAGLYDVTIEYDDSTTTGVQKEEVKKRVMATLQANRNLCEDFVAYREIENQLFNLCCSLELETSANVSVIKAEIFFRVQNYLCPSIRFYSLSEMLERKKSDGNPFASDEIFEGPLLQNGFIDDEELENSELRKTIRLSDLIDLISDIKGVVAVREIHLFPYPEHPGTVVVAPENKWVVEVAPGRKPSLSIDFLEDTNYFLKFFKQNLPVYPHVGQVLHHLMQLNNEAASLADNKAPNDLEIPVGKFRNPGSYYSIQNDFPAIYGLSEAGLPTGSAPKRGALAAQLKGYLLFFDQLMANYFAQLAHLKELFSTNPDIERTYFYQVVDTFADFDKIYLHAGTSRLTELETKTEDQSVHRERRNRFLDHLIARFAERFTDFAQVVHTALGATPRMIARYKCDFLSGYPTISSERALAYNYSLTAAADLWDSQNVSGLERRVAKLLGMANFSRRNLSDFNFNIYAELDSTPGDEFRFRVRDSRTGKIILSSSTHYASEEAAREGMRRAISAALQPSGYEKKKTIDNRFYFNVIDPSGEVIARRIEYFETEDRMNTALENLIGYLQENFSYEGMFLIESILLRPEQEGDPFFPICTEATQRTCADLDPYSYRIQVVLPAENGRFKNQNFRRFVEKTIREETPAHILPKICWIGKADMALLEKAYRQWIFLKSGKEPDDRPAKMEKLIQALTEVKSIYPSELLRPCETDGEKFILGSTAIGSLETETE